MVKAFLAAAATVQNGPFLQRVSRTFTDNALIRPISARSYVTSQTGLGKSPVSLWTVFAHRSSALLMDETSIFENPRSPHKTRALYTSRYTTGSNEKKKDSNWRGQTSY